MTKSPNKPIKVFAVTFMKKSTEYMLAFDEKHVKSVVKDYVDPDDGLAESPATIADVKEVTEIGQVPAAARKVWPWVDDRVDRISADLRGGGSLSNVFKKLKLINKTAK